MEWEFEEFHDLGVSLTRTLPGVRTVMARWKPNRLFDCMLISLLYPSIGHSRVENVQEINAFSSHDSTF
jgi:hypothetical protein